MNCARYVGRVGALAVALGVGTAVAATPGAAWAQPDSSAGTTNDTSTATADDASSASSGGAATGTRAADTADPDDDDEEAVDDEGSGDTIDEDDNEDEEENGVGDDEPVADDEDGVDEDDSPLVENPPAGSGGVNHDPGVRAGGAVTVSAPERADGRRASERWVAEVDAAESPTTRPLDRPHQRLPERSIRAGVATRVDLPRATATPSAPSLTPGPATTAATLSMPGPTPPDRPEAVTAAPAADHRVTAANLVRAMLASFGFGPVAGNTPVTPIDSPIGWAVAALVRSRKFGQPVTDDAFAPVAAQTFSSLTTTVAAPVVPVQPIGVPDPVSGVVTGGIAATDPDGSALTYTVTGAAATGPSTWTTTRGTVTMNTATGSYAYTPSLAARLAADTTANADTDTFAVAVSDGQQTTTTIVSVYVSPLRPTSQTPIAVGGSPSGVVVSTAPGDTRMYVANTASGTVSVIDTATGRVIDVNTATSTVDAIRVGSSPGALALSPKGDRLYVANAGSGTVSVIRTDTYQRIDANPTSSSMDITVGSLPSALQLSPNGDRLYVANRGSGTVSVIDTATLKRIDADPGSSSLDIRVGSSPAAMTLSGNGDRLFVANRGSGTVSVINTTTLKRIDADPGSSSLDIRVGSSPAALAVSPDGARLFVVNSGSGTVSVIDTATSQRIDADPSGSGLDIRVGSAPTSIAFSKDGAVAFVANGPDTVSVIDTRTHAVVRTVTVDSSAESSAHTLTLSADGSRVYVTDAADRTVRVVALARGNTAPISASAPSMDPVIPSTGAVSGGLNVIDPDGDRLTYSVVTGPARGSVTITSTGRYTYVPTQAAREQAAQPNGITSDTFTVRAVDPLGGVRDVSLTVAISPSTNRAPVMWAPPSVGDPDPITGVGTFVLNVSDPDGDPLILPSTLQTANGTVELWSQEHRLYRYTPTQVARDLTLQTSVTDTDTFSVTVSDGSTSIAIPVTVPIAPANRAPVASALPTVSEPSLANGDVTGNLNVTDPDRNPLTYTVTAAPTHGGVTVAYNGSYVYTPSQEARERVATGGPVTDTFVVRVTDTQYSVDVTVRVPIGAANQAVTTTPVTVGDGPSGVVLSGDARRAYVVNTGSNAVSVIDTASNTVVGTIEVGRSPLSLTLNPTGDRLYVTNAEDNTVTVVDTVSGRVVTTVAVPVQPSFNPEIGELPNYVTEIAACRTGASGDRVYVTATDGTVTVLQTADRLNYTVVSTNAIGSFSDLTLSADGRWLYGTHHSYFQAPTLAVIDTTTMTVRDIQVGPQWNLDSMQSAFTENTYNVAVSQDGRRVYVTYAATTVARGTGGHSSGMFITDSQGRNWLVTGGYTAVAVFDVDPASGAYTPAADVTIPSGAQDITLSADGRTAYVTGWDGKSVTMLDTTTNTIAGGFTTDLSSASTYRQLTFYGDGYFTRFIAVGADGSVYVTDFDDDTVYAVTPGDASALV
ncbi:hypothetical protein E4P42_10400 [Mycobacterium sp. PS03-16]|uniref:beta-propeller fold lactonase family protein n=1 Tax=Mycobacterium sp. PS03-16 TaxID=2559611 RepID=UPI0010747D7E|nr:beta-propeller fold lactonase family protein [Mycobacterium sp. PS03-16]TFV58898.1 hypothetical protein E4P42_10400 [Mycobacterium sp. PS03-16]